MSLNTQTSTDTTDKQNLNSEQELEFTNIENTPFTIVRQKKEYYGLIGNNRITESFDTFEECKENVTEISWDRLVQVMWTIANKFNIKENE